MGAFEMKALGHKRADIVDTATPAIATSDQNRGRQRISWSGDDQPLMRPPPPPPQPPPISGRLGSVSPAGFFSPVQSPSELSRVGGVSVRSRSAQRPGRRSDGSVSAPGGRFNERRSSYSDGNV